jgi:hypothetical protein
MLLSSKPMSNKIVHPYQLWQWDQLQQSSSQSLSPTDGELQESLLSLGK